MQDCFVATWPSHDKFCFFGRLDQFQFQKGIDMKFDLQASFLVSHRGKVHLADISTAYTILTLINPVLRMKVL